MAKLLAEEPDALMHARPDLWEPWRATAKATRPAASKRNSRTCGGVTPEWHVVIAKPFYTKR